MLPRPLLMRALAYRSGSKINVMNLRGHTIRFRSSIGSYTRDSGVDDDGRYEGPFMDRLIDGLTAARKVVFFDVGGQVGFDSLVASTFGAHEIHVFEPDPLSVYYLKKNLRGARYKLTKNFVGAKEEGCTITIDGYVARTGAVPTHMKLDIEGHELDCLDGMTRVLSEHRPTLFIEFHERIIRDELKLSEAAIQRFFDVLVERGYRLEYNGHHYAMHTSPDRRYDYTWHDAPPNHINFAIVATPRGL